MHFATIIADVSDIAIRKDGIQADELLMSVASEHGDEQAKIILHQLDPAIMARIVREHDVTKESILGHLISPQEVVAILDSDPATWHNIEQASQDEITKLMRDVADVTTGIILSHIDDEVWLARTFDAIAESDSALMYLIAPMVACGARRSMALRQKTLRFPYPYDEDGNIGHVFRLMREYAPFVADQVIDIVSEHANEAKLREKEPDEITGLRTGGERVSFAFQEALRILVRLQTDKSVEDVTKITEQMFEPL
jgi:hypothetical protein